MAIGFLAGLSLGLILGYLFNRERELDLLDRLTPDYQIMRQFQETNRQASRKRFWPEIPFLKKSEKKQKSKEAVESQVNDEEWKQFQEYKDALARIHKTGEPVA